MSSVTVDVQNVTKKPTKDTPRYQNIDINFGQDIPLQCLKCDRTFELPKDKDVYLAHLFLEHRLVIADVEEIANLKEYLEYWLKEFQDVELSEFCTTMLLDQLPDGTISKNEKYYLLSDILPQDNLLRKRLHAERLETVLSQHQCERTDRTFSRQCLYCRDVIEGVRADYLEHLFTKHFLQLGRPENLVFIDELVNVVQNKLENLVCLYCEKIFKDRATLKEHMRKKGHKRINPDIKFYDKFFLVNYKNESIKPNIKKQRTQLNSRTNNSVPTQIIRKSHTRLEADEGSRKFESDRSDSEWSDWDGERPTLMCLFCRVEDADFSQLNIHMRTEHGFDFDQQLLGLSFYQKVKAVNYIRRQMEMLTCVSCHETFTEATGLRRHLDEQSHYTIGGRQQWDQPEYFFPTLDDDGILCHLDDVSDELEGVDGVTVLSDEPEVSINKDAEALSFENFPPDLLL